MYLKIVNYLVQNFRYNDAMKQNFDLKKFNLEVDLLENLIKNKNTDGDIVSNLIHFCLIRNYSKNKIKNLGEFHPEDEYNHILNLINIWFMNQLDKARIDENYELDLNQISVNNEAQMFDRMLIICDNSKKRKIIDQNFSKFILNILNNRLKKSSFEHVVKIYFCFDFETLINKELIRFEIENDLIEKMASRNEYIHQLRNYTNKQESLEHLTNKFLEKYFPASTDSCSIFLTCSIYKNFFEEILNGNQFLSKKWIKIFDQIFDSFQNLINELIEGSIQVSRLKLLNEQRENFEYLSNLIFTLDPEHIFSKNKANFDKIKKLIEIRLNEWTHFNECLDIVVFFLQFCSKSKNFSYGSSTTLLDNLAIIRNKQSTRINEFCEPKSLNDAFDNSLPKINYFDGINNEHLAKMDQIRSLNQLKLVLFDHFFLNSFREKSEIKSVLEEVLPNALENWESLACSLDTASIKLKQIEDFLDTHFDKDVKKCFNELVYIIEYFNKPNKENCIKQLEIYFKFRECYKIAKIMSQVCTEFDVLKEFVELNELLKFKSNEFENFNLNKMDNRVCQLIKTLENYSSTENVECLEAFIRSKKIIKWIQRNVKDLNELKFLVDLISLSKSSEIQNNTDKNIFAKTFKEATTAYAPLIFEINSHINYDQIVSLCIRVWNNLKNDSNIAKKLIEIKDMDGVLEEINRKRGNVELSAIEQARQINQKGLFKIEILSGQFSIENIIKVDVTMINKVNKTQKNEIFTYEKLNELKSILVLLTKKTGDTTEDQEDANTFDYFIQIFDNCVRLANIFVNMCKNGCDLFNNFKMILHSDSQNTRLNSQPIIELIFNQNGAISDNKQPSLQILSEICSKMDLVLSEWVKYVEMVRDEYHFINYYTVNQVILIKSHLEHVLNNENIDNSNFDLLKSMFYNVRNDLEKNAFVQLARNLILKTQKLKFKPFVDKQNNTNNDRNLEEIKKYAKENGFSIRTVKDAYDKFADFNQELNIYCLTNDLEGYDENENFQTVMSEDLSDDYDLYMETHSLSQKLEKILQNFMNSNSLSIERLAIFLEKLNQSCQTKQEISREIPGYLNHRGTPNLITCAHQRDQIEVFLSIYAQTYYAPLPSNDEVLFCNCQTTAEEVCYFIGKKNHLKNKNILSEAVIF